MKDASNQEIIPIAKKLEVHTNAHRTTCGDKWGWITGCTKNIVWGDDTSFNEEAARKFVNEYNTRQPCGHPLSAIVHNGTTAYCGSCADDSLRENINKGIEA